MKRKLYESSWLEIEETRKEEILENLRNDTEKFHNLISNDTTLPQSINVIDYYDTVVRDVTKDERTTMYDFVCSNGLPIIIKWYGTFCQNLRNMMGVICTKLIIHWDQLIGSMH